MDITERQLIDRLRRMALRGVRAQRGSVLRLRQGIGDDCAVISSGGRLGHHDLLVTTDLLLEGIHFRRERQPADSVGHKVLARGLSDIAAMGGTPRWAFLSLALPKNIPRRWADDFFRGFFRLAEEHGVVLAGGDTAASRSGVLADIMVIGEVPRGDAVLRSGASPGDEIWVTGKLGGAAYALELLRKVKTPNPGRKGAAALLSLRPLRPQSLRPLFYPQPRVAIGRALRERGLASAMMDLSDGLSVDLARLCEASGVGACIKEAAVPRASKTPVDLALHGGEDFELLCTVPTRKARQVPTQLDGVPLTRIGLIAPLRRGVSPLRLLRDGKESPLPILGFQHF